MYDPEIHGRIIAMIAIAPENSIVLFAAPRSTGSKFDKKNPIIHHKRRRMRILIEYFFISFFMRNAEARISPKKKAQINFG